MEGAGKYGYFHMLRRRLPTKSLVESLGLSHKIGLKAIKERGPAYFQIGLKIKPPAKPKIGLDVKQGVSSLSLNWFERISVYIL